MGEIVVHEFMSLDAVIDAPTWTADFGFDPKMGEAIGGVMSGCRAILLGRNTYEMFAPVWSARTAEGDPGAPFFNDTAKHVVSSRLREAAWQNTEIVGYDAIHDLKASVDGDIYVSGSGTLVRAMLADGLVDQLHLFAYPLVLGSGPRLFEGPAPVSLSLSGFETYENGVIYLRYRT